MKQIARTGRDPNGRIEAVQKPYEGFPAYQGSIPDPGRGGSRVPRDTLRCRHGCGAHPTLMPST